MTKAWSLRQVKYFVWTGFCRPQESLVACHVSPACVSLSCFFEPINEMIRCFVDWLLFQRRRSNECSFLWLTLPVPVPRGGRSRCLHWPHLWLPFFGGLTGTSYLQYKLSCQPWISSLAPLGAWIVEHIATITTYGVDQLRVPDVQDVKGTSSSMPQTYLVYFLLAITFFFVFCNQPYMCLGLIPKISQILEKIIRSARGAKKKKPLAYNRPCFFSHMKIAKKVRGY